ncbi:MAG: BofC C-terminal domain-containing protein [Sporomusaceae bacterium]|nr:BofC C-terminal domain-containing protein [Sporomusaceae bacterium]
MLFSRMSVRHRWLAGILFCLATLSGYFGYAYFRESPPWVDYRLQPQSEQVQHDAKLKLTADTMLNQKMVYKQCGDEETVRSRPPESYVGMTLEQLQAAYPNWNIEYFDAAEVRMTLDIDNFCREHANGMYIGVKDGYVTVFYGRPGLKPVVKEVTTIATKHLMAEDIAELEKGIIVNSKEELLRTLEGMQSQ